MNKFYIIPLSIIFVFLGHQTILAQCNNTTSWGGGVAPTTGNTTSLTTCLYAGEYSPVTGVAATTDYQITSDLAGAYITVRQGTSGGPVIAAGPAPLNWTSTVAGDYFIHLNTNAGCGTNSNCQTLDIENTQAPCNNATQYPTGSIAAPNNGATNSITTCQYAGEYAHISGCAPGATYSINSSVATDYITVYQGSPTGTLIAAGTAALQWSATLAGDYYVHFNTNAACGTDNTCRVTDITHIIVICTNTTNYTSVNAPSNALVNIGTCMFAGEYYTVNNCVAGQTYTSSTDLVTGFFTVHQGTSGGPVVASGVTPLSWNATVAGDYFVHLNTTAACGTDAVCHTADIEHTCLVAPTGLTATPNNVCSGHTSLLTATSAGNTINWYTVATGGTSIGSSASGANFSVNPTMNTTYYAAADNGSCEGARAAISVSVDPGPNDPTNVTATPATICLGASTNLNATSYGFTIVNDFAGVYDPSMWTESHSPVTDQGIINSTNAPTSISIESSDGGNTGIHSVIWTVTVPASGNITFDWNYVTTDVHGAAYDYPQYAINGTIVGNIPGFDPNGANSQSGSCTIAVAAGQTFSLAMTASDDILGSATTVFSNFTGPDASPATIHWFTTATGGTSIGSSMSGVNFPVTPTATTTYYAEGDANSCLSPNRTPVIVTVNTPSTAPSMAPMPGTYCPNSTVTMSASGGVAGTGATMEWYTGPNGTGTWMGSGSSLNITPAAGSSQTFYVRREGTCNTTADDAVTVTAKHYIYGLNGNTTSNYCTDNSNWHHFYSGNEILLSIQGDISGAPAGYPEITIWENNTWYQQTQGPFTPASCTNGLTPGEERFEMARSWNVDFGGGTLNPPYNVRFYYRPAEKTAVETAINNHIATYTACGYSYKYANPNGFYWFKNTGSNYTAPDYDGLHLTAANGTTSNSINYAELTGITSFSGGGGAATAIPTILLPVQWLHFTGETDTKVNYLNWATESEQNSSVFNIQRSVDGINFETIGSVTAQGNSSTTHHYSFDDEHPFKGINYYRLALVDLDGKVTYSKTIQLVIPDDNLGYSFYPNPTYDVVNYQYEATEKEPLEIEVIDVYGRTLSKTTVTTEVGLNKIPVDLSPYVVGSYMIRVHHLNSSNVHTTKAILTR